MHLFFRDKGNMFFISWQRVFGDGLAPFRFFTPFPLRSSRRLRNSLRSNILAARLICGLPQISGVPRGYVSLVAGQALWDCPRRGGREPHGMGRPLEGGKRSCSPSKLPSGALEERFGKAKSSRSLHPSPNIFF